MYPSDVRGAQRKRTRGSKFERTTGLRKIQKSKEIFRFPPGTVRLNVIIPDRCVGGITGKDGERVMDLANSIPGVLMIRGLKQCMPGTEERSCHVAGDVKGVAVFLALVADKIREELGTKTDRVQQVRIQW
jgi:hypothetical protein